MERIKREMTVLRGSFRFQENDGSLVSVSSGNHELPLSGAPFFSLGLRSQTGELVTLSSADFHFSCTEENDVLLFRHSGHPGFPELCVRTAIREQDGMLHFRPDVRNVPFEYLLEWIDLPQPVLPEGGTIFWPQLEGVLIDDPRARQNSPWSRYHVLGFLGRTEGIAYSEGGYYPGVCQMQFLSWEKDGYVLYFGAHDLKHGTKAVEYEPLENGTVRLSLQTFCGGAEPYLPEFDYVLSFRRGNWMDACSIYREWISHDPRMPEKGRLPALVKESPVVVIYPVRGYGDDKGRMDTCNEYYPYVNALPHVENYAERFESKVLALLMHWEGTAPWAPPYVWPPCGGEEELKKFSDALHAGGNYLGLYCSGTAWTQKSCILAYSRERECEEKGLKRNMIRGPKGEIEAVICCAPEAQRLGFDMCLTEEWPRRTLCNEFEKIRNADVDYVQFFDQNLGGAYHACYSRAHRHPAVPGAWQTEAMQSLLAEMTESLRGKEVLLGCEGAAADAYLRHLPFNDLRACWNYTRGIPVPGYQFVFHEYCNNFMGNQCGIHAAVDCRISPGHLLYRTAYAFVSGDLLSVVLKNAGRIHYGWGASWDLPEPDQESVITLIRNLNAMRRKYGKFLQFGRMEKMRTELTCGTWDLAVHGKILSMPSVLSSAWTAPDGERAEIFVNYLTEAQKVRLRSRGREKTVEIPPLTAIAVQESVFQSESIRACKI